MKNDDSALSWLKNGIWALGLAGLYSIVLVVLRTPQLSHLLEDKSLFKSSLIIHVDLSVLAWMLSITCVIWSIGRRYHFESVLSKLAFLGMILMATSPLLESSRPVMNNYVPILENIWFIIGLSLFGGVVLCFAVLVVVDSVNVIPRRGPRGIHSSSKHESPGLRSTAPWDDNSLLPIIKLTTSLMYIMVWVCFALSYRDLMTLINVFPIDIDYYYELLFWSGGHLMQFIYTQVVMFVWLVLAQSWMGKKLHYYKIYAKIFVMNFALGGLIFYGHFAYEMSQYEFTAFFTKHMQYVGGIAPILFILVLGVDIWKVRHPDTKNPTFVRTAFIASTLLFFVGGLIGILISGINVSIPAHYHGSIVGISIAFLGLAYVFCFQDKINVSKEFLSSELFEKLGKTRRVLSVSEGSSAKSRDLYNQSVKPLLLEPELKELDPSLCSGSSAGNTLIKLANIQLCLITIGQLLHISGLALAGGYGIMRKNPDGVIATSAKVYMGMMGGGGLIAIIGGLMFVYICGRRLYNFQN